MSEWNVLGRDIQNDNEWRDGRRQERWFSNVTHVPAQNRPVHPHGTVTSISGKVAARNQDVRKDEALFEVK